MEKKHTELPWMAKKGNSGGYVVSSINQSKNEDFITGTWRDEAYLTLEDANFIVRAANSHYQMLKAAEDVVSFLGEEGSGRRMLFMHYDPEICNLRNAIALAKGKAAGVHKDNHSVCTVITRLPQIVKDN